MLTALVALLGVVGGLAALLAYLTHRNSVPGVLAFDHQRVLGTWPSLLSHLSCFFDWRLSQAERGAAAGREVIQRAGPFLNVLEVLSPRMVQYMLKDNFDNFEKGPKFQAVFHEFLGSGIFNVDGDEWRSARKTASHMFSVAKLNNYMLDTFKSHAVTVLDILAAQQAKQPATPFIDMQPKFFEYTMDSMSMIGFGMKLDGLNAATPPPFVAAFDGVQEAIIYRFLGPPLKYRIQRLLHLGPEKAVARGMPVINDYVYSMVKARKANMEAFADSGDLLSLFVTSAAKSKEAGMSDKELRDTILNFMLAGRDTTAALLTWMFHELALNPHIERAVLEEIAQVFGPLSEAESHAEAVANISHDTLKAAIYLEAVILETLRLHPPVASDSKRSIKQCTFPDGTVCPPGKICAYSPYVFGRLRSIWGEDAQEFKPERHLSEPDEHGARTLIQPNQYKFPAFNAGYRLCLGRGMAIMEAKTLTVAILRKFHLQEKPDHDPMYKLTIILSMKYGLPMSVHPRDCSA